MGEGDVGLDVEGGQKKGVMKALIRVTVSWTLTHATRDDSNVAVKRLHHLLPLSMFDDLPGTPTLLPQ